MSLIKTTRVSCREQLDHNGHCRMDWIEKIILLIAFLCKYGRVTTFLKWQFAKLCCLCTFAHNKSKYCFWNILRATTVGLFMHGQWINEWTKLEENECLELHSWPKKPPAHDRDNHLATGLPRGRELGDWAGGGGAGGGRWVTDPVLGGRVPPLNGFKTLILFNTTTSFNLHPIPHSSIFSVDFKMFH